MVALDTTLTGEPQLPGGKAVTAKKASSKNPAPAPPADEPTLAAEPDAPAGGGAVTLAASPTFIDTIDVPAKVLRRRAEWAKLPGFPGFTAA
jgi:hypothetical protein